MMVLAVFENQSKNGCNKIHGYESEIWSKNVKLMFIKVKVASNTN